VSIRLADDVKSLKHNRQLMEETKMLFSGAVIDKKVVMGHLSFISIVFIFCLMNAKNILREINLSAFWV
jgi:hypothetical protein